MSETITKPKFKYPAPDSGMVEIRPYNPRRTFGNAGQLGTFTYNRKKVGGDWDNPMGKLEIPGLGIVLNMEVEEQATIYEIIMNSDQWKGIVNPMKEAALAEDQEKMNGKARFYIINRHADAKSYLVARERKDAVDAQIKALKPDQLKVYGLMFKIAGDETVIRAQLYQMAEDIKARIALLKVFESPDRERYELITKAEGKSDANNNQGLYHNQSDVYFYNGETIGVGIELVVSKMKKDDVFYRALKAFANAQ